jgi:hypothetical protein
VPDLPRQPDEVTLEELMVLVRKLQAHPENRDGADKTWVLDGIRRFQAFFRAAYEENRWMLDPTASGPPPRPSEPSPPPEM